MNRTQIKSPFLVVQEFISPLECEELISTADTTTPDEDKEGKPIYRASQSSAVEDILLERIINDEETIKVIEEYYDIQYKGLERPDIEWFPTDCVGNKLHCENSKYMRKKWLRVHPRDLTGVLFLTDYNDTTPFDDDFEVYGGKLEFPQHRFGFNSQRGTLIIYPSGPHFINHTAKILAGELFQVRFHIVAEEPLEYDPEKFPGDFTSWFEKLA